MKARAMWRQLLTSSLVIAGTLGVPGGVLAQAATADHVAALLSAPPLAATPQSIEITAIQARGNDCAAQRPGLDLRGGLARCAFDDIGQGFTLNLRQASETAAFQAYGSFSRSATGIFTARRQLYGRRPGLSRETSVGLFGIKGELFDKRLRFTIQQAWSNEGLSPVNAGPLGRTLNRTGGGASTFKLEADLIKIARLRWQLAGEFSDVGTDFSVGDVLALPDLFAITGQRVQISSTLKIGGTGIKAGWEQVRSHYGRYNSLRLGVEHGGISLRVSQRNSSSEFSGSFGTSLSRSDKLQVHMDIENTTLFPGLVGSSGGLKQFIPYLVSLSWEKGRTESSFAGSEQLYDKGGWAISGFWETRLGETSLSYRHDGRDQTVPAAGHRDYTSIDITHSIRRGPWRLGAMLSITRETRRDVEGFEDRTVSFGPSLAYSRRNGPKFSLSIGRDNMASTSAGGFYRYAMGSTAITARLDLTDFLRKRFERPDLSLKIEYRKRVESLREEYLLFDEDLYEQFDRTKREGLLLTFSKRI